MWGWVDWLSGLLLDATLAAAVLLGLAALLMVGCRQPARRCSVARGAILGALAIFPLVGLWPARPRIDLSRVARVLAEPFQRPWPRPPSALERPASAGSTVPAPGTQRGSTWARLTPRGLTLTYLAGAACGLAWLSLGWFFSAWLVNRSVAPRVGTTELYQALRPPRQWLWPRLRVSARVHRPVLLGLIRPAILIPTALDRPAERTRLRLSLLHELAHADRGDAWFSLAGSLAQAVWFFLPWAWWIRTQMRLDQEFLADHRASAGFGTLDTYAASLVDLAAAHPQPVETASARPPALWGTGSALFQRVLMLVRCPYPVEMRAPRWWRWSLPPAVACTTLLASALSLYSEETRTPAPVPQAGSRSFALGRLVVAEAPAGPDGTTPLHQLPMLLPEHFSLLVEVWADPSDLGQTRVAGYPLGPLDAGQSAPEPPRWHQAEVKREGKTVSIYIDGKALVVDPDTSAPTAWLSVQPAPDRVGLFRNIRLSW